MPEKKRRNPFEEHIESDSFDVSDLENATPLVDATGLEVEDFLDELPAPLTPEFWDEALDDRQRLLCVHLITSDRLTEIVRESYEDKLDDLSDDQIRALMTIPVLVGMLLENRLHVQPTTPDSPPIIDDDTPTKAHPLLEVSGPGENGAQWGAAITRIVNSLRDLFGDLFRRVRQRL